ncbi:MAG: M28 family peptidase [Nitrososphaeria archaeon]
MKKVLTTLFLVLLLTASMIINTTLVTAGFKLHDALVPSTDEIFSWIEEMVALSVPPYYRRSGTIGDAKVRQYLFDKFVEFGLQDVRIEPVEFVRRWYDEWSLTINGREIPCFFMRECAFTHGITAEVVYAGETVEEEDNVEGKIAIVDVRFADLDPSLIAYFSYFVYDPGDTMKGLSHPAVWVPINMPDAYINASMLGAVGFVGILKDYLPNSNNFYPDVSVMVPPIIPAVWVSREDGSNIKEILNNTTEPMYATLKVNGSVDENAVSGNVVGVLPGKTDDIIIICSHHDSAFYGAVQDASGTSVVLAIAKYFAKIPRALRNKTLVFVIDCNHFDWDYPKGCKKFIERHPELIEKTLVAIGIEHIAKDFDIINGELVYTGYVEPRGLFAPKNPLLIRFAEKAIVKNNLVRTLLIQTESPLGIPGEPQGYYNVGVPIYSLISGPEWLFDLKDTLDKVAKDQLVPVTKTFIDIINWIDDAPSALIKNPPPVPLPLPPFPPLPKYPGWGKLYQGIGFLRDSSPYNGESFLYIRPAYIDLPFEAVYLGINELGWIGPWKIEQKFENHRTIYKCQGELGTLWIYVYNKTALAKGDGVFFVGKVL